jgi:hypothetical protein
MAALLFYQEPCTQKVLKLTKKCSGVGKDAGGNDIIILNSFDF